jgi:cytochrome c peroxidase
MTMKKYAYILFAISVIFTACSGNRQKAEKTTEPDRLQMQAKNLFGVLPSEAPNPDNQITPEKVHLGKVLFYDTRLSAKGNQSCNTCHNLSTYGVDNEPVSEGDEGLPGDRNSPTVYNSALAFVQFWDGRSEDVEDQAGGPILNPVEMNMHSKEAVEERLDAIPAYVGLFEAAFPGSEDPVTFEHVQMAIAAFERTLLTPSRFDSYLEGDADMLTEQEKRGLEVFIEVGCTACHMGVLLGGNMYQKFGLFQPYHELTGSEKIDKGRAEVTKNESDSFMFKVPSMRNVAETYPYFHDGSIADLEEAVRIMAVTQLGRELTDYEVEDISVFLKSLTGKIPEEALAEPELPGMGD